MAYTVPTWQDSPSTATPLSAADLNQGSTAVRDIDRRISQRFINVKDYGATGDGSTNDYTALQAALNAAAVSSTATVVFFPAGHYNVGTRLTVPAGTTLQGVGSGTYPVNGSYTQLSQVSRLPSMNDHIFYVPAGNGRVCFFDMAIDGNKNNNTAGCGVYFADAVSGEESQAIVERCYFHDNPGSNVYIGINRRGNKILNSVFLFGGNATSDGVTVASADNTIFGNICGENARAGICLGTTVTQHWAAAGTADAAAVTKVTHNDTYKNKVGVAVAAFSWGNVVAYNGIDRNTNEGITVYDGDSNVLIGNCLHSNGTATDNTYGHIDIGSGVTQVSIISNEFAPLDGDVTNRNSYGITIGSSSTQVYGGGNTLSSTATVSGLANQTLPLLGDVSINAHQQLYGYLSWAYDQAHCSGGALLGTAGIITLIKLPWPVTAPVSNIVVGIVAGGATLTANQCLAGIYSSSGSRLAQTGNQATAWTSTGTITMSLTGAPVKITGGGANGFVYVALLWNGTTSPSFLKNVNNTSSFFNGSLSAAAYRCARNGTGQTSLPSSLTLSSNTAAPDLVWAALS